MSAFVRTSDRVAFAPEKMRKQGLFESSNMFCDLYCFEPGQTQTAHAHAGSDKVYFVLEGCAEVRIGDETRRLEPGEAAHAAPGVAHGISNPGPDRLVALVFMAPRP
jgi:quercetin dioxygenase-like cupin family protein